MIIPSSFAIHVTYTCPLTCAHCCFLSSPANADRLPIDHILETIQQLDTNSIKLISFTGGEPFLLGAKLVDLVHLASQRGLSTRIVTSAYFAKRPEVAKSRIQILKDAGLKEITISWDDFHEEFVDFECVANLHRIATQLGIFVYINMVQGANPRWTAEKVAAELGIPASIEFIADSPLNLTGRAELKLKEAGFHPDNQKFLGPCPYILTGPTLSAKNKLLACCGVIPETQELILDEDFRPENLTMDLHQAVENPLYNWLYLRGPYQILEWISQRFDIAIPAKQEISGNCEACRLLFHSGIRDKIPEALQEMNENIMKELVLMESLGLLRKNYISKFWSDSLIG